MKRETNLFGERMAAERRYSAACRAWAKDNRKSYEHARYDVSAWWRRSTAEADREIVAAAKAFDEANKA